MNYKIAHHFTLVGVIAIIAVYAGCRLGGATGPDIGTMTWTPRADWIDVTNPGTHTLYVPPAGQPVGAMGNGSNDDTAAIQGVLSYLQQSYGTDYRTSNPPVQPFYRTIYFPKGTYKITGTLQITLVSGLQVIGCGGGAQGTTIQWGGAPAAKGSAMFWANGVSQIRYSGLVWDGGGTGGASCAYLECGAGTIAGGTYLTGNRHENESFNHFSEPATYSMASYNSGGIPAAGIVGTVYNGGSQSLTGEEMVFNCHFGNCTIGILHALNMTNFYVWNVDQCEFDSCGTGIDFASGFDNVIDSCHFQASTWTDIQGGGGVKIHHCTSSGSYQFFWNGQGSSVLQDCWVDQWTSTTGAVQLTTTGPFTIYDCNFTHPPTNSLAPIETVQGGGAELDITMSNDYATGFTAGAGMVHTLYGSPFKVGLVQPGARTGIVTSSAQTFLKTSWPADSGNIIDVTQGANPANRTLSADATSAIQTAIDAARTANNGSIVYIPAGFYMITAPLNLTGSNYTVQGEGFNTQLCWMGASGGTVFNITNPTNLSVQLLQIACHSNIANANGVLPYPQFPACDPTTITGICESSTAVSSITYDDVYYDAFGYGNPFPPAPDDNGIGVVLNGLAAGSTVYMPHLISPLTVKNSGGANILARFLQIGTINVSGTAAKTGFLGATVAEGGQAANSSIYNINVTDNQDLAVGDYYTETCLNDVSAQQGVGTVPGRLTIEEMSSGEGRDIASVPALTVTNYGGRIYLGSGTFGDSIHNVYQPIKMNISASNPLDVILSDDYFVAGLPNITNSGANLIEAVNQDQPSNTTLYMTDSPNTFTGTATTMQLLQNNGFESDAANPSPTSTAGYNPASWTVSNTMTAGGGVRNATVVSGGSPFGGGSQKSLLWVDSTGSTSGSGLGMSQYFTSSPATSTAVETFDFRLNSTASNTGLWIFTGVGSGVGPGIHLASNGSTVYLGANIGGSDTYVATLATDVWYHACITIGAPSAGKSNATLSITPWNGTGPGATTNYTIDGIPAVETTGFNCLYMYSAAWPIGSAQSANLDNIGMTIENPAGQSIAQSLDHLRQLGENDLYALCGVSELIQNNGFELDPANASATTNPGCNPASWSVGNTLAAGGGERNATVVNGGSPFGAGTKSLRWVDTTGSSSGSNLYMWQGLPASSPNSTAVETFDFCLDPNASGTGFWVFTGVGSGSGPSIHLARNGSNVYLGANIGGSDTYVATLSTGVWYRARIAVGAPSAGYSKATLYITPWNGTGPGTTTNYTIDGIPAVETTGFNWIYINSSAWPMGAPQGANLDNIGLVTNAALATP
jgi:hypothetical protein